MIIEIQAPNLQIKEGVLEKIERKILKLSKYAQNISRAEIYFTEHPEMYENSKSCKIHLTIFGDSLFVHKHGDSFEEAAEDAIKILKKLLKRKFEKKDQLPDEITSTVTI